MPGSGSLPPAARRRRKWDLPEPFEPSTATRSPKNTSTSNGFMSPVSSSRSHVTARLAVRPPASRTVTFWSRATTSGRPASSNLRRRVRAAWYRLARPSLNAAFVLSVRTSSWSLVCSSSQRRASSASRSRRSARAWAYVAKPPPCTHTVPPPGVGSSVATWVAVRDSSSRSWDTKRTVLDDATSRSSSQRFVGTSRWLSGSSSSRTSSGPRSRAVSASRFCSPPDSDRTSRHCAFSNGTDSTSSVTSSQPASAS
ncbi:Uncharacterised protein [Mycobacteroides abscessus]|nr:Uncharacterised protein [Mycobacteroides abscessus]